MARVRREANLRVHIVVSGRVQGVGFRYFTQRVATSLGITGWVKNLPTGEVEIEAQADRETLDKFIEQVRKGPALARVDNITINEIPEVGGEGTFSIRY